MKIVIIQPPVMQLNAPYPSGAYLSSFFKCLKNSNNDIVMSDITMSNILSEYRKCIDDANIECVEWIDFNVLFFHELFSKEGLTKLFDLSWEKALKTASNAEKAGDEATAYNIKRYLSQKDMWIQWIDFIVNLLTENHRTESTREKTHQFIYSPSSPRGNRMMSFLQNIDHDLTIDDGKLLATLALADLADYTGVVFDKNFALINYASSLAESVKDFKEIENQLESPIIKNYLIPLAEKHLKKYEGEDVLFCISVPFPGVFVNALSIGKYIKQNPTFKNARCAMGGGYFNTEHRDLSEKKVFEYTDFVSYDKGYGSYLELFRNYEKIKDKSFDKSLYKLKYLKNNTVVDFIEKDAKLSKIENWFVENLVPDYSDIDFNLYPRLADDTNPMHRLWSDGTWIKSYLAYGCYWHQCAFCDISLDYVCNYKSVSVRNLFNGLKTQAENKGVYGIHFVDEALPPKALFLFAKYNCENNHIFSFWGNIRFEKTFDRDLADFLSYAGLIGVSAGLEIATKDGLKVVNKGTDIKSIVNACASFKEAGILVHAYMIYGYWEETPQMLINSMETLRQIFKEGLLDSSFFHKFVLTKHSGAFMNWKKGMLPKLKPILPKEKSFAQNDLRFENENKSERYSEGLDIAVNEWMHGRNISKPVNRYFDFQMPSPSIEKDYIEKQIDFYENEKQKAFSERYVPSNEGKIRYYWLSGNIISTDVGNGLCKLEWFFMQEAFSVKLEKKLAESLKSVLLSMKPENKEYNNENADCLFKNFSHKTFSYLRQSGLCRIVL